MKPFETDMSYMFCLCPSLKKLNLTNFNTNNVTEMIAMFSVDVHH